jgi:K+-sensing histidine kinase KdpD
LLVPFRGHIAEVNVALVLVVFVLLGAVIGGRWAGLVAAVVAGMSFDFMHTRPYNSLKIANAADVETTVLLILVGVIVGEIALRGDRIRAAVGDHRRSISRVHRVAQLAAAGDSVDDVISAVRAELIETLHLQECLFERPPFTKKLPTIEPSGAIDTNVYRYTRGGFELPRDGVEIPVVSRDRTVGRFVLVPSPGVGVSLEERMIAVALADQLGVVLGRAAA